MGRRKSYQNNRKDDMDKWRRGMEQARSHTAAILSTQKDSNSQYYQMAAGMEQQRDTLAVSKAQGAVTQGTRITGAELPTRTAGKTASRTSDTLASKITRRTADTKARTRAEVAEQDQANKTNTSASSRITNTFRALHNDIVSLSYEINASSADPDSPSMDTSQFNRAHDTIFRFYQECAALHTSHPLADAACGAVSQMLEGQMFNEELIKRILDHYLQMSNK